MNKNNIPNKNKSGNINSELLQVELTTKDGEIIKFQQKKQNTRVETEFMLIWQDGMNMVLSMGLSNTEMKIFNCCLGNVDKYNKISATPADMAEILSLRRETVSRTMKNLAKKGVLVVEEKKAGLQTIYSLSPEIGGRGKLRDLNIARKKALANRPEIDDLAEQVLSKIDPVHAQILKKYIEKQSIKK